MRTIEITIDTKGQATVQTKGYAGASCRDASKFIEQALGEAVTDEPTPEFYQPQGRQQVLGQR